MRQVLSDAQPPYLELVEITKRFGSFVANEKVSLKLQPGTFHALLGENGAGKSTLVKCLMGYHLADEGEIIVGHKAFGRFAARMTLTSWASEWCISIWSRSRTGLW